jgi:hypothetical protein
MSANGTMSTHFQIKYKKYKPLSFFFIYLENFQSVLHNTISKIDD